MSDQGLAIQSTRSADAGSIRIAARAGSQHERRAIATRKAAP